MSLPDWQLPAGVSRSLWEFAHDPQIARDEERHLAQATLLDFDRRTLVRWFPDPGRMIDLGCGTGRLSIDFTRRGWEVVGVDLSNASLKMAQERADAAGVAATFVRGNLCDLGCLPGEHFDAALLMFGTLGMIRGAEHRSAALREAHRILKPGGGLALHVHNVWRHLFFAQGRRWLLGDCIRRLTGNRAAGDTHHGYRGIPRMFHHSFTLGELRRALSIAEFELCDLVPLAPEPDQRPSPAQEAPVDLVCRGWWRHVQATGWLALARRGRTRPAGI